MRFLVCLVLSVASMAAFAKSDEKALLEEAQDKLKATFNNYQITDFRPSPIPGIYEVHAGPQLHYYAPEQNLLIFGQIWSAAGENLTERAKADVLGGRLDDLPLDTAILIQEGDIPLIEIFNPDCGYCKRYEEWVGTLKDIYSIERKVVFLDSSMFPNAPGKMKSVVCSDDPKAAYKEMMDGKAKPSDCEEAASVFADHKRITDSLGVQGTPTFLLPDGRMIHGFAPKQLEEYFISATTERK